jgi:hypothetical protein
MLAPHVAFDNLRKLPGVACPVFLVEAMHDQLTSAARSEELAHRVTTTLTRVRVDADHDGAWAKATGDLKIWLGGIAGKLETGPPKDRRTTTAR